MRSNNLPNGWIEEPFEKVTHIANGQVDPTIEPYINYPHVGPENIGTGDGRIINVKTAMDLGLISGKYLFDENAIIYSKIRPNLNKVCIPGFVGICSADMYPVWPTKELDRYFLFQYMLSDWFVRQATIVSNRTGMPKINREDLNRITLWIPPLAEQRKIAAILGTWDESIAAAAQLIATLKERKRGLMQRLLTGRVRFPEFANSRWEKASLGQLLTYTPRKVDKPAVAYTRMGIRSHGKGTFTEIVEDPSSNAMDELYEVKGGDLIVNITFAWEQAIAIVDQKDQGALVSHRFPTYEFNQKRVNPNFFRYVMLTKQFLYELDLITPGGAGRNRVMSKTDFLKIHVELPSLEEQHRIASTLLLADEQIRNTMQYRDGLQQQKRGLMQRLLTGQVRVTIDHGQHQTVAHIDR